MGLDMPLSRRCAGMALAVLALGTVSACGSSDDAAKAPAAAPTTAAPAQDAATDTAASPDTAVAELVKQTSETQPPTSSPQPAKGKTVWWVSCGAIAPDCALPMQAAKEAARKMGITFKIADGNLNQAGKYLTATRDALAQKPDGLIVHALDCVAVRPALKAAKAAGVPVLGVEMPDCDAPPTNQQKMFTADMKYTDTIPDTQAYFRGWGQQAAKYLIAASGGKAKIILNEGTDAVFPLMNDGFTQEIAKCSGCEIVDTVKFTAAEQIPNGPWIQRFRATLTKHPEATATFIPSDYGMVGLGGGKAVQEMNKKMIVVGGSGSAPGMSGVRSGLVTADTWAHDAGWLGYAAMDTINRMMLGKPTVSEGVGTRIVDKDNNLPAAEDQPYSSPVDWKAAYDKIWGVG